jgi:hypothetical protein
MNLLGRWRDQWTGKQPTDGSLPVFGHEEQELAPHVGIPDHPGGES